MIKLFKRKREKKRKFSYFLRPRPAEGKLLPAGLSDDPVHHTGTYKPLALSVDGNQIGFILAQRQNCWLYRSN